MSNQAKSQVNKKVTFLRNYDKNYQEAYKANELLHREMREEKAQQYELIKEYERKHLQHMIMRDPYKSKISEDSLRGTFMETSKRLKRKRVTDGFNDTDLAGPRYDAI